MKKTIMLATIVASLYSMANSISGHVEFINNNNLKVETTKKELKDKEVSSTTTSTATNPTSTPTTPKKTYKEQINGSTKPSFKTDLGVKTEITLNKIGLSFGAEFMGKDAELYPNKDKKAGYKFSEDSNVYLKYQIPEFMNIKSSAKLGFIPKVSKGKDDKASFAGEALVELEGSYILDTINLNLNSSTHLPLYKPSEGTYGDKMFSVHKLTAKGETGVIKDLDAYLEIKNDYSIFNASNNQDTTSPLKYVKGGLVGDYKDVKNLTLTAHADFLYLPSDDNDGQTTKNILKNDDEKLTVANSYSQAYEFEAKYTMLENKLDLKASLLGQHVHTGGHTVQVGDVHEYFNELNDLKAKLSAIKDDCKTEIDSKIVDNFKDEKDLKAALDKLNADIKKNNTTSNTAPANNDPKANTHTTAESSTPTVTPAVPTPTNNDVKKDKEDCIAKIDALLKKIKENNYDDKTDSKLNKLKNDKRQNAITEKAYFGTKLGVAYRPINNLEITAGTVLGGTYVQNFEDNEEDKIDGYDITGYIRLDSGVKYVYTPVKNITVVPEFNISGSVDNLDARNKNKFLSAKLNLNPKASIAYTPIKNLEIAGLVELPIEFKHVISKYTTPKDGGLLNDDNIYNERKFAYSSTTFKTGLNIKYSW